MCRGVADGVDPGRRTPCRCDHREDELRGAATRRTAASASHWLCATMVPGAAADNFVRRRHRASVGQPVSATVCAATADRDDDDRAEQRRLCRRTGRRPRSATSRSAAVRRQVSPIGVHRERAAQAGHPKVSPIAQHPVRKREPGHRRVPPRYYSRPTPVTRPDRTGRSLVRVSAGDATGLQAGRAHFRRLPQRGPAGCSGSSADGLLLRQDVMQPGPRRRCADGSHRVLLVVYESGRECAPRVSAPTTGTYDT